ncbi:5'/3'-nucleotidase SurE [Chlamydia sp. 12-01]|uniref:5'/3'-nucleotidase SurE n=1 Tax=Chlamydia sp. 12-01 TaxID=3002742 RepID=UPI0035D5051C
MTLLVSNLLKADFADIYIVAPKVEQSGKSMAFTCRESVVLETYDYPQPVAGAWSVSGTPVDCVKIALSYLFKDALPDLVLSGINSGSNAGRHVFYSGTTGAAMEAILYGVPAIGLSQENRIYSFQEDNPEVPEILKSLSLYALSSPFGSHPVGFNVNFPASNESWKGMQLVSGGEEYSCGVPKLILCNEDSKVFILTNCPLVIGEVPSEERIAILDNYISVAPLAVRSSPIATLSLKEFQERQVEFQDFINTVAMRK